MPSNLIQTDNNEPKNNLPVEVELAILVGKIKNSIWFFGIPSWVFGISDRSLAALADGYLSPIEILQLLTASFLFFSWLYLRPETNLNGDGTEGYLCPSQVGNFDLKKRHMISQEYILPFPYLCQIYHLLSLKHLETVHKFSLNNLKVINVSHVEATDIGGIIKFKTVLDSPVNALKIWRQPIVEVDLILHNPYTVELSIPVYNNKRIIVIFNVFPLTDKEHQFFIDIYSDLEWNKPILQIMLHFAACLTLFEDLPYLRALADKNVERLFSSNKSASHETMWLFNRFTELYGSKSETTKLIEGGE
ncbi:hypothetical protein [Tolypothrix sp. VBCCA 56010]|uniref:hypothetical protein n=1 Tax=Tolypothrix sp. VBCCA 56010 TaxID=3137731 RepID=UPI003D7DCB31